MSPRWLTSFWVTNHFRIEIYPIDLMQINWLTNFVEAWQDRVRHERIPHAVLLAGPVGDLSFRFFAVFVSVRERQGFGKTGIFLRPF